MEDALKGELLPALDNTADAEPDNKVAHDGDDVITPGGDDAAEPKRGTLAWLQAQPTVTLANGETVPACHRIPAGAELAQPSADSRCRVILDGERCKGTRLKAYGLCMGHVGGGGAADLTTMRRLSSEKRAHLKILRQTLSIGSSRAADPRVAMRFRAAQRAQDFAKAIVDGPLDADLSPVEKQRAALAALDATFPLQTGTVELSLVEPEAMSWKDMQETAISLLG